MGITMKLTTHHLFAWACLLSTYCISHISASGIYHHAPSYYPSYYAASYPSYFAPTYTPTYAPSYLPTRYLWPSYTPTIARIPLATVPAAVPAAVPAVPAAVPAVPAYKYVTVIPQNSPPNGYSVNYFRKYLTTVPAVVAPRPAYAAVYPHVHQSALVPHVNAAGVPYAGAAGTIYPHVQPPYAYKAAVATPAC